MHKKFEIIRTKIKGSCQSERKMVTNNSKSASITYSVNSKCDLCENYDRNENTMKTKAVYVMYQSTNRDILSMHPF